MDLGIYQTAPENRPYYMGELDLDLDGAAERYMVIDRIKGHLLVNGKTDKLKVHLSVSYATSNNLMVLMLDDNQQYNAAVADGVQLTSVNAALASV